MTSSPADMDRLLDQLAELPADWHAAGLLSVDALASIVRHAGPSVAHSVETGSGRSTIFFSHFSGSHVTFSLNDGQSISQVWKSKLFQPATVRLVEGPTQLTLPKFVFEEPIDVALIDGPHGFPVSGSRVLLLLSSREDRRAAVVDDVHIPTIRTLFTFLRDDKMWKLLEVVQGRTAVFRRTEVPTFDPLGDGWWLQRYNHRHVRIGTRLWAWLPASVRRFLDALLRRR